MSYWKASLVASAAWFMAVPALATPPNPETSASEAATPTPDAAAKLQSELTAVIKMVEEWLGLKDMPPVDESRLVAARTLVTPMTQRASVEKMFDNLYGRMFKSFDGMSAKADRDALLRVIGVPQEQIERVSEADLDRISAILNPQRGAQEQHLRAAARPLIDESFAVLQPAMQEGLARAYARRFTNAEMMDVYQFFLTPTGAQFASELLPLQAHPEVILSLLHATPELVTRVQKLIPQLEANFKAMPQPRDIHQLSDREIKQIADILKINVKQVKAALAAEKAEQEARKAAIASEDTSFEAYDRANWSDEHKAAVTAAEAASEAAQSQAAEAQMAAIKEASQRLSSQSTGRTPKP